MLGGNQVNGNVTDTECDRLSNSVISEMQVCFISTADKYLITNVDCLAYSQVCWQSYLIACLKSFKNKFQLGN